MRLLTLLLALNRQPVLAAKWTRSVMPLLEVAPVQFQQRFEAVDRATPAEAAALLVALVDETYDLIERTVPGWKAGEVQLWRTLFHYQRPLWQEQPPT